MAATELFANTLTTTVSSGGTTAPSSGTSQTWTVAASSGWPAAVTGLTQFHVADLAAPSELIAVTNVSGSTWTVTRGAESTTPVAHVAGFTIYLVISAGYLTGVQANRVDWLNVVTGYGADPAGVADSTTAISNALAAAPAGGVVYLPAGVYKISSPIVIPNWVTLMGTGCAINDSFLGTDQVSTLKPTGAFASSVPMPGGGTAVGAIVMTGSSSSNGGGQEIRLLNIDCSAAPASVDGICAAGWVYGVIVRDVSVQNATGIGLDLINSGGAGSQPDGWRIQGLLCANGAGSGLFIQGADLILDDAHSIANAGSGFEMHNIASSILNRCRASDNGGSGYYIPNNNNEWFTLNACISDTNANAGLLITGSGTQVCNINDFISSGDVTSGVEINGVQRAVLFTNLSVTSGGTPPTNGMYIHGSNYYIAVDNAFIQATTPFSSATPTVQRAVTTLVGSTVTTLPDTGGPIHGGVFGDGSDGAVTFDGSTTILGLVPSSQIYTMTRDILCTAITINNGVTVKPNGYRIFCQGTITSNGTISNNGNNAAGSTAGGATNSGTTRAGTGGGAGGTGASGSGGNSTALTSPGAGAGGNGGAGTSGGAGTAGTITGSAHTEIYRSNPTVTVAQFAATTFNLAGGTGGGGGGSDSSSNAGGGGGGAGGMIMIAAWAVNNGSGTISATGGNAANSAGGNAGGGGGGGGGVILIYTLTAWTAGTTAVTGGSKGTHTGSGSDGSNGGTGTVLNVVVA